MKTSIWYWLFAFLLGEALKLVPLCRSSWLIRLLCWYIGSQWLKRIIFKRCPFEIRFPDKEHVVVVTGASAGIGSATAIDLCARGAKVIWAARDTAKAQRKLNDVAWTAHHGKRGYVIKLDLASKQRIDEFVDELKKRRFVGEKYVHCLILNAAYWGPRRTTENGFEETFGVNHLGHMYLTFKLIDVLKASAPSRIIVLGSDIHRLHWGVNFDDLMMEQDYSAWRAYGHSKLCNMLFGRELARRLKGSGVTVSIVHPGTPVPSELMRNSLAWWTVFHVFVMQPVFHLFCRTTMQGAQTTVYCACSEECGKETGNYYENMKKDTPNAAARDDAAAKRLWNISCEMLKIDENWA